MFNGLTHYVPNPDKPGWCHAIAIESCETCGGPAEACNSLQIQIADAKRLRLQRLERRLPEQYYDEDLGQCVCDECPAVEPMEHISGPLGRVMDELTGGDA